MAGKSKKCKSNVNQSPGVTSKSPTVAEKLRNDLPDKNNANKQEKFIFRFKVFLVLVSVLVVLVGWLMLGKTDNYMHTEIANETENLPDTILKLLQQVFKDGRKNYSQGMSEMVKTMEKTINKVKYDEYEQKNLCGVSKGIQIEDFNSTVKEIAEFLNLPDRLANVIIRAAKFKNQKQASVESKTFKANDGFLYFGKFVIVKTPGNTLAFSYSLHGIKFNLSPKSEQSESIGKDFISFSGDVMDAKVDLDGNLTQYRKNTKAAIAKEAIDSYVEYYLHKSYEKFMDNCKGQLDMLEGVETEVKKSDEDTEKKTTDIKEEKMNT